MKGLFDTNGATAHKLRTAGLEDAFQAHKP